MSGFSDGGGSGVIYSNCISRANALDGFTINKGTGGAGGSPVPGDNGLYIGCNANNNLRDGFSYHPEGGTAAGAGNFAFQSCKSYSNGKTGFNIQPLSSYPVTGVTIADCEAYSNVGSGFETQGGGTVNSLTISNCRSRNNGTSGTDTFGIRLLTNVTRLDVTGNKCWDDQGGSGTQTYGIQFGAYTFTSVNVANNNFNGNKTGAMDLTTTPPTFASPTSFANNLPVATPRTDILPTNYIAQTMPLWAAGSNTLAVPASGTLRLVGIYLPAGTTISNITFVTGSTAGATITHVWCGLYDSSRNQLATTTDNTLTPAISGSALTASTAYTTAISTTAAGAASSYTTLYSGTYYVGILVAGTTMPTFTGYGGVNALLTGLGSSPLTGSSDTAQTTPPAFAHQATTITALSGFPYIGLS